MVYKVYIDSSYLMKIRDLWGELPHDIPERIKTLEAQSERLWDENKLDEAYEVQDAIILMSSVLQELPTLYEKTKEGEGFIYVNEFTFHYMERMGERNLLPKVETTHPEKIEVRDYELIILIKYIESTLNLEGNKWAKDGYDRKVLNELLNKMKAIYKNSI